jgi:hypothetical protein
MKSTLFRIFAIIMIASLMLSAFGQATASADPGNGKGGGNGNGNGGNKNPPVVQPTQPPTSGTGNGHGNNNKNTSDPDGNGKNDTDPSKDGNNGCGNSRNPDGTKSDDNNGNCGKKEKTQKPPEEYTLCDELIGPFIAVLPEYYDSVRQLYITVTETKWFDAVSTSYVCGSSKSEKTRTVNEPPTTTITSTSQPQVVSPVVPANCVVGEMETLLGKDPITKLLHGFMVYSGSLWDVTKPLPGTVHDFAILAPCTLGVSYTAPGDKFSDIYIISWNGRLIKNLTNTKDVDESDFEADPETGLITTSAQEAKLQPVIEVINLQGNVVKKLANGTSPTIRGNLVSYIDLVGKIVTVRIDNGELVSSADSGFSLRLSTDLSFTAFSKDEKSFALQSNNSVTQTAEKRFVLAFGRAGRLFMTDSDGKVFTGIMDQMKVTKTIEVVFKDFEKWSFSEPELFDPALN